uniref:Uncharacterized protein n=1 Tax=Oryza punctata TaxID=4537 RepID=A0A0E0LCE2_ORYPU
MITTTALEDGSSGKGGWPRFKASDAARGSVFSSFPPLTSRSKTAQLAYLTCFPISLLRMAPSSSGALNPSLRRQRPPSRLRPAGRRRRPPCRSVYSSGNRAARFHGSRQGRYCRFVLRSHGDAVPPPLLPANVAGFAAPPSHQAAGQRLRLSASGDLAGSRTKTARTHAA